MASSSTVSTNTPICPCGKYRMRLSCAGPGSQNPGRYYYKCLSGVPHNKDFFWWDEYHGVVDRIPQPTIMPGRSTTGLELDNSRGGFQSPRSYLEFHFLILFMSLAILVGGILIGKLM